MNSDSVLINTATESGIQKLPIWRSSFSPQPALTQTGLRASDRSWRAEQGRVSPNKERELLKHYSQLDARSDSDVHTTGQTYPQDYKRRHLRKTSSSIHRHLTVIGEITAAPNIILLLESQIFFPNIPKYSSHGIPNILLLESQIFSTNPKYSQQIPLQPAKTRRVNMTNWEWKVSS